MNSPPTEKRLDVAALPLIVISAVSLAIGSEVDSSTSFAMWLGYFEFGISVLFVAEYITRLFLGGRRYAFSFYGMIDLLASFPALFVHDMMALRILRVFRLLRLIKLGRYGGAAARLGKAIRSVKEEFVLLAATALILLSLAAFGIRHFEHEAQPDAFATFSDCLWWAVVSLTTVGYGDVYPVTNGGKVFASIILLLSLGIVAAPAGLIAAALSRTTRRDDD